jgi:hypothetical protein
VIAGWIAVLFGVLVTPLAVIGLVGGGDDHSLPAEPEPTTLPKLPPAQCTAFHAIADAGQAAYEMTVNGPLGGTWDRERTAIDATLARYEFTLQAARRTLPMPVNDDLRRVVVHVRNGRAILEQSRNHREYRNHVFIDVIEGFSALNDIAAKLGDACGEDFELATFSLR